MKTITLVEPGQFAHSETPHPDAPGPGEALVRIRRIGVCGTDLHAFRGKQPFFTYPRILGHELGVEVVALGPGTEEAGVAVGDRCAVEPYLNCGICIACRRGKTNCCVKLQVLGVHTDGGMREFIVVPATKLHKSETLTLDQLALVETLGIGAHAVQRAALAPGETVLVIGAGPIGLSVVPFAQAAGARVIVKDVNEQRLAFVREQFGVEHTIMGDSDATIAALLELTDGDRPTAVMDATGNPQSMMETFNYIAPGGRIVFVGLFAGDVTFHDPNFHRREISLLSSRNSTPDDFRRIIGLLESGKVDTTPWITHRIACDDLPSTFASLLLPESGVLKAVVEF